MEIRSPYKQDSFSSFYKNKEGSYPNSKININSYYFGSNSNKKNIIENNRNNFQNIPQEHLKAKNNLSIINETMSNYYSSDKKNSENYNEKNNNNEKQSNYFHYIQKENSPQRPIYNQQYEPEKNKLFKFDFKKEFTSKIYIL